MLNISGSSQWQESCRNQEFRSFYRYAAVGTCPKRRVWPPYPRHIHREIRHLNSVALGSVLLGAGFGLEAKKDVSFCEDAASASAVVAATPVLAFFAFGTCVGTSRSTTMQWRRSSEVVDVKVDKAAQQGW